MTAQEQLEKLQQANRERVRRHRAKPKETVKESQSSVLLDRIKVLEDKFSSFEDDIGVLIEDKVRSILNDYR